MNLNKIFRLTKDITPYLSVLHLPSLKGSGWGRGRFLFLLLSLFLLSSCLDEHPKDQIDEELAYSSASTLYNNAVGTLYNYIGGTQPSQGLQGTYRGV